MLSFIRIVLLASFLMLISFVLVFILDTILTISGIPLSTFVENFLQIFFVTWGLVKFGSKQDKDSDNHEYSAN